MKRIASLAVALATANAAAEQLPMEHVLVSVPLHKKQAETALPVTVLTGDELQRQAATTIGETLGNRPGIASASFGPGVGRPVIRGQQGPRALTLQNGTLSADVSSLSPDHSVAVEALLAESIEVLRGPSTLLYGGGAIGGVVNIIDNRIPRTPLEGVQGGLEYRYDDAPGMDSGVFRLEGGNGTLAFHLSGSTRETDDLDIPGKAIDESAVEEQEELTGGGHEEGEEHGEEIENTDGYIANTDSDADNITGGISYHFGQQSTRKSTKRNTKRRARSSCAWTWSRPATTAYCTCTSPSRVSRWPRETWESRLELVHDPIGGAHGVLGLQWRDDEFSAIGEEAYVPETESTEIGLFLVEDFHRGDWTWEVGIRGDWVERDPDTPAAAVEPGPRLATGTFPVPLGARALHRGAVLQR
jgi:iron complex outermembrane receptor protein